LKSIITKKPIKNTVLHKDLYLFRLHAILAALKYKVTDLLQNSMYNTKNHYEGIKDISFIYSIGSCKSI